MTQITSLASAHSDMWPFACSSSLSSCIFSAFWSVNGQTRVNSAHILERQPCSSAHTLSHYKDLIVLILKLIKTTLNLTRLQLLVYLDLGYNSKVCETPQYNNSGLLVGEYKVSAITAVSSNQWVCLFRREQHYGRHSTTQGGIGSGRLIKVKH